MSLAVRNIYSGLGREWTMRVSKQGRLKGPLHPPIHSVPLTCASPVDKNSLGTPCCCSASTASRPPSQVEGIGFLTSIVRSLVLKNIVASVCNLTGLDALLRFTNRLVWPGRALVLMYHRLREDGECLDPFYSEGFRLSVNSFEHQMRHLKKHYTVISLDRLVASLMGEESLPTNAIAITFDDGYRDTYTLAYPILKKYRLPATVFLATGFVGTGELLWYDRVAYLLHQTRCETLTLNGTSYSLCTSSERRDAAKRITECFKKISEEQKCELLNDLQRICGVKVDWSDFQLALTWEEVREMARNGITFGAHTVTHPILTRVPLDIAEAEILESKLTIEKKIGKPVGLFAYPNGQPLDFDEEIEGLVEPLGFKAAFTTINGLIEATANPFSMKRVCVDSRDTPSIFKARLAGLFDLLRPMKHFLGL